MTLADDYMLQRFPDDDGKLETNKPYQCRIDWYTNGYPSFEELSALTGTGVRTIYEYSSRWNWKDHRNKVIELEAKDKVLKKRAEVEQLEVEQSDDIDGDLEKLNNQISFAEDTDDLVKIIREKRYLRGEKRTNKHLPNSYNDTQKNIVDGAIDLNISQRNVNDNTLKMIADALRRRENDKESNRD